MVNQATLVQDSEGILFTLKDIVYNPTALKLDEAFTVKGKINLFRLTFLGPIWVIVTVTYPETWWEEIIPIIGSPQVRESATALGGDFEIKFDKGFQREGEFSLAVRAYAGPTMPLDSLTLPPFPPVSTFETTFTVAGEMPPEAMNYQNIKVVSYSKNGGTPVSAPGVLQLNVGDTCRVNVTFDHKADASTGKLYAAIGNLHTVPTQLFDEVLANATDFSAPASTDWQSCQGYVDIPITSVISSGSYSLYAKLQLDKGGEVISPFVVNVISIGGGAPPSEVTGLEITSYEQSVAIGGVCHVKVNFDYQGLATSKVLHAAIGVDGAFGFDEILSGEKTISIPASATKQFYEATVNITITSAIDPAGSPYDLYAKMDGIIPAAESPHLQNVITITGAAQPTISNLTITNYTTPVQVGQQCIVTVSFDYIGPAATKSLYAAVGNDGAGGFDEICTGNTSISIPAAGTVQTVTKQVAIPITSAIDPAKSPYDLYAKIDSLESPHLLNVVTVQSVTPPPPTEKFQNLTITSYTTPVDIGGVCQVTVSFQYQGQAQTRVLYAAIGNSGAAGFDEILAGQASISLPESSSLQTRTATVNISVTSAIDPAKSPYDLYAKINGVLPKIISSALLNVITITGIPPTPSFSNFRITSYDSSVLIGGSCKVIVGFDYQGPAVTRTLYAAIGVDGTFGFDEVLAGSVSVSVPASATKTARTASVSIPITSAIDPAGSPYDLYAKMDGLESAHLQNIITVTSLKIGFKVSQLYAEYVFSGAQKWLCYYWDPSISGFVGDQKWYGLTSQIQFSNVKSGGYFAVFLLKDSQTSSQFTSPVFSAVNGGVYQYNLSSGTVSKIG